ncbi:MAG: V-type ATP synthase subunit E [Sphaerochaetaceae bacterium]
MEIQIQDLVDSIKKEGVDAAQKEALQILSQAKEQASELIAEAKSEASRLIEEAKKQTTVMEQGGKAAISQAGRDVILTVKAAIEQQFERVMLHSVTGLLDGKEFINLIAAVIKSGLVDPAESRIELPKKSVDTLVGQLQEQLAKELKAGLEIQLVPSVQTGFRIAQKKGSSYFDFSEQEIVNLLKPFLMPQIHGLLLPSSQQHEE